MPRFNAELFHELRDLGYNDLIIANKLNMKPESLLRQLWRHHIKPTEILTKEANQRKAR